jgi:hypothetical protein
VLLAAVADIRSQLGFDNMTDVNAAISMAMDAAESMLSSRLNSEFDKGTFVDTFYVRSPPFKDGPAVETQFRLRRGLISSLTSVIWSQGLAGFGTPASETDVTAVVNLHPDKGVVKDFTTRYERAYVQVTYVAGFDLDTTATPPVSYDLRQVPDWLQNAAKLLTLIGLVDAPIMSEAGIKLNAKMLTDQFNTLTSIHLRYAPISVLPL